MQAHWHAAASLPADHASRIDQELARVLHRRQQQLASVLGEFGVGSALHDKGNLHCGLRDIWYHEANSMWRIIDGREFETLASALAGLADLTEAVAKERSRRAVAEAGGEEVGQVQDAGEAQDVLMVVENVADLPFDELATKLLASPEKAADAQAPSAAASSNSAIVPADTPVLLLNKAASSGAALEELREPEEPGEPEASAVAGAHQPSESSAAELLLSGHRVLHQPVALWFSGQAAAFHGTITGWQPAVSDDAALFRVTYDDGDEEDVNEQAAIAGSDAAKQYAAAWSSHSSLDAAVSAAKQARRANRSRTVSEEAKLAGKQVAKRAREEAAAAARTAKEAAKTARAAEQDRMQTERRLQKEARAAEQDRAQTERRLQKEARAEREAERKALRARTLPTATELASYLRYRGDGAPELDALHYALSDAVLDVYVEWHLPGGRLADQCPPGQTRDSLRAIKHAPFRVPFAMLTAVATFANSHIKLMRYSTGPVAIPMPGHVPDNSAVPKFSYVRKMMTSLKEEPTLDFISKAEVVETAYLQALRELGQVCDRKAQPLLDAIRDAILGQCGDLTVPRDVRLATWTVNAPRLMQRTYEGTSSMHIDMEIKPREERGGWRVPGWTKTSNGLEGFVDTWHHRSGFRLAGCTLHEVLEERPLEELRVAACSPGPDGRLCLDNACPVCLMWLSRRMQGLGAMQLDGVHPIYQEINESGTAFTGRVVDPEHLLKDLRRAMDAEDARLAAAGLPKLKAEGRVLYMARHGGIMQFLMMGRTIEWVAERARIPVKTLVRHYRPHNIIDDAFESNGQFGLAQLQVVRSMASSDGFDPHERLRHSAVAHRVRADAPECLRDAPSRSLRRARNKAPRQRAAHKCDGRALAQLRRARGRDAGVQRGRRRVRAERGR